MGPRLVVTLLACVLLGASEVAAGEGETKPPPAGTMRFAPAPDAFPEMQDVVFGPGDRLYALAGLGKPWRESMHKADKGTSAAVRIFVGNEQKGSAAFYPGVEGFEKSAFVLDLLPDPSKTTQFLFGVPRALAALPPGRHDVRVQLWSFAADTPEGVLAEGTFPFLATEEGRPRLQELVRELKEAKVKAARRAAEPSKPPTPAEKRIVVRRSGSEHLTLRGDEIVREGAVVGRFDGQKVQEGGSIVGEIRGRTFRHEGADVWSLDKGNLYPGTEIRWEGAIIGDIREDGRIWWEGSDWGSVRPYGGTDAETMRLFAALYYFSDFFRRK